MIRTDKHSPNTKRKFYLSQDGTQNQSSFVVRVSTGTLDAAGPGSTAVPGWVSVWLDFAMGWMVDATNAIVGTSLSAKMLK